jgi:hypothetical protein
VYQKIEHPVSHTIPFIPRCIVGPSRDNCYTIGYSPQSDSFVVNLVEKIRVANDIPITEIIGFVDTTDAENFLLTNPNSTQGIYHFTNITRGVNNEVVAVQYHLHFKYVCCFVLFVLICLLVCLVLIVCLLVCLLVLFCLFVCLFVLYLLFVCFFFMFFVCVCSFICLFNNYFLSFIV